MGYELYIEREPLIEEAEWEAAVGSRTDVTRVDTLTVQNPVTGKIISMPGPLWRWDGHPTQAAPYLDFRRGRIAMKNPDDATIALLKALATALGAEVVGDEGEAY